jgi:hypothetical protein
MAIDPGFCAPGLDRADALRSDPDGLRAAMMRPGARLLRMTGLDPDIGEDGGLSWGTAVCACRPCPGAGAAHPAAVAGACRPAGTRCRDLR